MYVFKDSKISRMRRVIITGKATAAPNGPYIN